MKNTKAQRKKEYSMDKFNLLDVDAIISVLPIMYTHAYDDGQGTLGKIIPFNRSSAQFLLLHSYHFS